MIVVLMQRQIRMVFCLVALNSSLSGGILLPLFSNRPSTSGSGAASAGFLRLSAHFPGTGNIWQHANRERKFPYS